MAREALLPGGLTVWSVVLPGLRIVAKTGLTGLRLDPLAMVSRLPRPLSAVAIATTATAGSEP